MILYIIEERTIEDSSMGYSNDISLMISQLQKSEIYYTSPKEIINSYQKKDDGKKIKVIKINSLNDLQKESLLKARKQSYLMGAIDCLLQLPFSSKKETNFNFRDFSISTENTELELTKFKYIFDRSEPISLNNNYYKALKSLLGENFQGKIYNSIDLRLKYGDKESVLLYDQNLKNNPKQQIGFKTIKISLNNNLEPYLRKIVFLYLAQIKINNKTSLQKLLDGILQELDEIDYQIKKNVKTELLEFLFNLFNQLQKIESSVPFKYGCIKPINWFGGVGVKLLGEPKLGIMGDFTVENLLKNIGQIYQDILKDSQKTYYNTEEILSLANITDILLQEQAEMAEIGDLRIFITKGKIQGVILRVPKQGSKIANMHQGGHVELLPLIDKESMGDLKKELEKYGFIDIATPLNQLINKIEHFFNDNLNEIVTDLKKCIYLGFDALLTKNSREKLEFKINEINSTSPMGQVQIDINNLLLLLLQNKDFCLALIKEVKFLKIIGNYDFLYSNTNPYVKYLLFNQIINKNLGHKTNNTKNILSRKLKIIILENITIIKKEFDQMQFCSDDLIINI